MERNASQPLELFSCYARKDRVLCEELNKHLAGLIRSNLITVWYDGDISPGTVWEQEIEAHLKSAHIILLLVSPDFLNSDYCYSKEMTHAIERHHRKEVRVIPVLLRPIDWTDTPFSDLQILPSNAQPITRWPDRDDAFEDVAKSIRQVVNEILEKNPTTPNTLISTPSNTPVTQKTPFHPGSQNISLDLLVRSAGHGLRSKWYVFLTVVVLILLLLGLLFSPSLLGHNQVVHPTRPAATATSAPQGTPPQSWPVGTLVLNDPLQNNEQGYGWHNNTDAQWQSEQSACQFRNGTYHMRSSAGSDYCATNSSFPTYRYEIQLAIVTGNEAGMVFQLKDPKQTYYYYSITVDGRYALGVSDGSHFVELAEPAPSSAIHSGFGQWNTIAIAMLNGQIVLYINNQKMKNVAESRYTSGNIGIGVNNFFNNTGPSTEVMYRNAKVWTL